VQVQDVFVIYEIELDEPDERDVSVGGCLEESDGVGGGFE
jgi:hypothetical protein